MKKYIKPEQQVVKIQQHSIICTSPGQGYEVIGTGQPNAPAGIKRYNAYNVWDDNWQNP